MYNLLLIGIQTKNKLIRLEFVRLVCGGANMICKYVYASTIVNIDTWKVN